jgi:hypothetical protein
VSSLDRIKDAQLEDARGHRWWHASAARIDRWTERAKSWAAFGAAIGALVTMSVRTWHYIADRRVAPADLPATGQPTIATDRVEKPKAP